MRVGLDIDGVLRDLVGAIKKLWERLGRSYSEVVEWRLEKAFGENVWEIIATEPYAWDVFYRLAAPYEGAVDFFRRLKESCDVVLISWQNEVTGLATMAWLKKHGMEAPTFFTRLKERIYCDIYLDDGPPFVRRLLEAGRHVVVMDRPWNRGLSAERVFSYDEFLARYVERRERGVSLPSRP